MAHARRADGTDLRGEQRGVACAVFQIDACRGRLHGLDHGIRYGGGIVGVAAFHVNGQRHMDGARDAGDGVQQRVLVQ